MAARLELSRMLNEKGQVRGLEHERMLRPMRCKRKSSETCNGTPSRPSPAAGGNPAVQAGQRFRSSLHTGKERPPSYLRW